MTIRTILVDDEPLATQGLQLRLEAHDDVEVVATASNGREAIRQIKTNKPDLVFLDIQMPGFDGFSVIQGLMEVEPPLFVFVTAYSDHAVRAFESQAVDYLVKPVDEDRLAATLDRVRQRLSEKRSAEEAERLKEALVEHAPEAAEELELAEGGSEGPAANRFERMINIKDQGQIFRVDVDTIGAKLPSLLLQPLIENAIKYAVTPSEDGADIWMTASRERDAVRIEVADNGNCDGCADPGRSTSTGVGLANIRERLAQAYGSAHGFTTKKNEHGGFSVIIEIPYQSGEED
jgi:YesN/AraC family two-component response regulator